MDIVNYYEIYIEDFRKANEVESAGWDCSLILESLDNTMNSLSLCNIDGADEICDKFVDYKQNIVNNIELLIYFWKMYDSLKECYSNLHNYIERLFEFDKLLKNVYSKKPVWTEKPKTPYSYVNGFYCVDTSDPYEAYESEVAVWEDSVKRINRWCEYYVDIIERIKDYLTEINKCQISEKTIFRKPPSLDLLVLYFDNVEHNRFGCPLELYTYNLSNNDVNVIDLDDLLPNEIKFRNGIHVSNKVCNVDSSLYFINGVSFNFYSIYIGDIEKDKNQRYIEKSVELLSSIPSEVLNCVASQGTSFSFFANRRYNSFEFCDGQAMGYYSSADKRIRLDTSRPNAILHEFGHAYDNYLGEYYFSGTLSHYSEESGSMAWLSEADAKYLNSIDIAGYNENDYLNNKSEFFAEGFSCYFTDKDSLNMTEYLGNEIERMIAFVVEN